MNNHTLEEGLLGQQGSENKLTHEDSRDQTAGVTKWGIILLNCTLNLIGNVGGPVLTKLYYLHGGSHKWLCSWLQSAGFPVMLIPIAIIYMRDRKTLASAKFMSFSLAMGLLYGVVGLTYSYSLLFLAVSTSTLIMATNLAFTALFAKLIVGQKFTAFSIAAVVLMTVGAALLAIKNQTVQTSDQVLLFLVHNTKYLLGFFMALLTSALTGFMLPCTEYFYSKTNEPVTYSVVLQFMVGCNFIATLIFTIGMLINKDFEAIPKEASEFGLGATAYYVILVSSALVWPMLMLGSFGLVFCTSSLFSGIFNALMTPVVEVAALIVFHETFTIEKDVSLVLCLCGFASYFYGIYRENNEHKQTPIED